MNNYNFIGKGGFGIVFNPPINFNYKNKLNFVGKIFYDNKNSIQEIKIGRFLEKIDPKNEYFIYSKTYNVILIDDFKSITCKRLFDFLNENLDEQEKSHHLKLYQNIMINGGIDIKYYFKKNKLELSRIELLKILKNIFLGIKKLNHSGYIHQDLKYCNILICQNTKNIRIIDFGLLMHKNNLYNTEYSLYYEYIKSFEFSSELPMTFTNYLFKYGKKIRTNYLLDENVQNYINPPEYILYSLKSEALKSMTNERIREWLFEENNFKEAILDYYLKNKKGNEIGIFLNKILKVKYEDRKEYFIKNKIYEKSDTFSLGILILELSSYIKKNDDNEIIELFEKLVFGLLDFNPLKRLNIKKAFTILNKILKEKVDEKEKLIYYL